MSQVLLRSAFCQVLSYVIYSVVYLYMPLISKNKQIITDFQFWTSNCKQDYSLQMQTCQFFSLYLHLSDKHIEVCLLSVK